MQDPISEELRTTNEKLLKSNEELQSSNAQLQSVNEILFTVNAQYQQKIEELIDSKKEVENLLSSARIGILYIDKALNIRYFSNYVADEFNLLIDDIGRPLLLLSEQFLETDIISDVNTVLREQSPIEREIHSVKDRSYMAKISPYRTTENSIEGLVIIIIDSYIDNKE